MKQFKANIAGFILFVLVASSSFITCEIGLGRAVDTKPPTVSIAYPPVQSVIKNTFTMTGKAADETSLGGVTVRFRNTSTGDESQSYDATVSGSDWTFVANPKKTDGSGEFELPDGKYEVTVTATDGANRKSVATTTYEIDNTAPILVLKRPGTLGPFSARRPRYTAPSSR